jgi:hypothetical protein
VTGTTNPVTDTVASVWIDHIFLQSLSADDIVSTARIFDEDVVPVEGENGPMMVPLSDHFGMRSVVSVP